MIPLRNGHRFTYMVASGALGFPGNGYWYQKPLVALGLIRPELFTVVIRTLTLEPRLYPTSNLSWIRPWTWLPWSSRSCVQFLPNGGVVNKVGLYNPGITWWCSEVGPYLDYETYPLVASIWGSKEELIVMTHLLNGFPFQAIEVNVSCPNTGHRVEATNYVIQSVMAVREASRHPVIIKLSVEQNYIEIVRSLEYFVDAVSLNSVPWREVFKHTKDRSPMEKVGKPGSGDGAVSGRPAQKKNWEAVKRLVNECSTPVIAPSIMEFDDLARVRRLGARAISFGAIHIRTPWKPTNIVLKEMNS